MTSYSPFHHGYVFVLIYSDKCSHCPEAKSIFESIDGIESHSVNLSDLFSQSDENTYHKKFGKLIMWFPMFMLIERELWYNVVLKPSVDRDFTCEIFNGMISDDKVSCSRNYKRPSKEALTEWIDDFKSSHIIDDNLCIDSNPWIVEHKKHLTDIPMEYHKIALAPIWARSETGKFLPSQKKMIPSAFLEELFRWKKDIATGCTGNESSIEIYAHLLKVTEHISSPKILQILERHLDVIIDQHYI